MPKFQRGMPNCIKIALLTHKKSKGLIQASSPLGILFPYKNSVVQTGLFLNGYAFSFGKSTLPIPL